MSSKNALDKVRETLMNLKESIDQADDRHAEAKQARVEADARLEKALEEKESYRRRIQLLQDELEKARNTLVEKQERLEHVEGRSLDDDEKRREFEGIEIERDDQLIALEEEALLAKQQAHDANHILMESQRKLQVLEGDLDKVHSRLDAAETKEQAYLDLIERNGEELRTLEDRDNEAAEREIEAEEKLRFLEDQLKEAVSRAESAERDVVRNENIVAGVKGDIQGMKDKHADIDKETEKITELATAMNSGAIIYDEPEPEPENEPEPEEPEGEED